MNRPDFLHMGAMEIAQRIRRREVSALEVMLAHIARAEALNPGLNAIVVPRYELALAEARQADIALDTELVIGPLHGVPCSIKEGLGMAGLPHTSGSVLRMGKLAKSDGSIVARVRQAGAIPIGLTNMSEMALWPESDNHVYGRTSNPYDLRRTSGGSSGGEAASVAAGAAAFGLGTDGGGSIRIPAAYCGVFGHKPSSGLVPLSGHLPLDDMFAAEPGAQAMARYFAAGPIARSAADLMPLLRIIAGPDGIDSNMCQSVLRDPASVDFAGKTVLVCEAPSVRGVGKISSAAQQAVARAAHAFELRGARVRSWEHPLLRDSFDIWLATTMAAAGPSLNRLVGNGSPVALLSAAMAALLGKPRHTPGPLLACVVERYASPGPARVAKLLAAGRSLREDLSKALGPDGLLLLPVTPGPAPLHGGSLWHPFDVAYCALFNALELPATVAPVGLAESGLPASVQLVACHNADHITIAGALLLEDALGGWFPPPIAEP
ncbi:amidase [Undibacterium crateris]|uniref:amidase n=1 Tax=Undibacterium crateris TaxID=2528175 RepID=UPI00138A5C37|nr:amidase [Undibacterium crateris]NDI86360.1 amidase [Undibacterium crateris]